MPIQKNKAAQELAAKRHLSLTPERRKEIAIKASKAAAEKRSKKLSTSPEEQLLDGTSTLR